MAIPGIIAEESRRFSRRAEAAKITVDDARSAARVFFPKDPPCAAVSLSGGFSNANFQIESMDTRYVLRFFWAGPQTAERELSVLRMVAERGVSVPRVFDYRVCDGHAVGLIEFIEGEVLSEALRVSPDQVTRLMARVGEQLGRAHRVTFESAGLFDSEARVDRKFADFPEVALEHVLNLRDGRVEARLGAEKTKCLHELVRRFWPEVRQAYDRPTLTHCDFNPKNILVDLSGMPRIIDWEFAMAADRMIDIGNFFRFEQEDYPAGGRQAFVQGYEISGPTLPQNWERAAKLMDLANMVDFLGVEANYTETFHTARTIVDRTFSYFSWNQ
jgi:Ser/Thr protein kinase RdoA (MazF antagonist)